MKKSILIFTFLIFLSVLLYQVFLREGEPSFTLIETKRGDIYEEIFETGQVRGSKEINLTFQSAGRIEKIYVEVGEKVKEGDVLAKLENSSLKIQLQETESNLVLVQARLNKLLKGASQEEIQVVQTAVNNAEISLKTAQQSLEDVQKTSEENLSQAYKNAQNVLDEAYLKIYNSFNVVDLIQRTYFGSNDQAGLKVRRNKNVIETEMNNVKIYINTAKESNENKDIDLALSQTETSLRKVADSLKIIREICEDPSYRGLVSSTDKTLLDNERSYINTILTSLIGSQQNIALTKITNDSNINTAQSQVLTAEGTLKKAQDELALLLAPPRQEDVELYEAEVNKAKTRIQLFEKQIEDTVLRSPISGKITRVNKKEGEQVQPALQDIVFSLLGDFPLEIKANIYEENIVKIKIGNPVDISLIAFPEKTFKGRVVFIDPVETIIHEVVYYEITVAFEEIPENIKPGMTVDLIIQTDSKEDVLTLPRDVIERRNGKTIVEVLENDDLIKEKEIEIGIRGTDNMVEIISGIKEGEKVIQR